MIRNVSRLLRDILQQSQNILQQSRDILQLLQDIAQQLQDIAQQLQNIPQQLQNVLQQLQDILQQLQDVSQQSQDVLQQLQDVLRQLRNILHQWRNVLQLLPAIAKDRAVVGALLFTFTKLLQDRTIWDVGYRKPDFFINHEISYQRELQAVSIKSDRSARPETKRLSGSNLKRPAKCRGERPEHLAGFICFKISRIICCQNS